jgi:hypothetical protein
LRLLSLVGVSWVLGLLVYAAIGALAEGRPLHGRDLFAAAIASNAAILLAVLAVSNAIAFYLRHRLGSASRGAGSRACRGS